LQAWLTLFIGQQAQGLRLARSLAATDRSPGRHYPARAAQ